MPGIAEEMNCVLHKSRTTGQQPTCHNALMEPHPQGEDSKDTFLTFHLDKHGLAQGKKMAAKR